MGLFSLDKFKIYFSELFMIFGLIFMCLLSGRHLSFFYSIGFIYLSIVIIRYLNSAGDRTLDILMNLFLKNNIIYFLFLVLILFYSVYQYNYNLKYDYVDESDYPVGVVNYIKNNLDYKDMIIYNDYNVGSYLLLNDIPVYIDSRCDLYLKEFNGMKYSVFDEGIDMPYNYEKKFNKYGVTHAIIKKKKNLFYKMLEKDSNYNIIYVDKYFVLFERVS